MARGDEGNKEKGKRKREALHQPAHGLLDSQAIEATSRHFPDEAQGLFLLNNTIGVQGVLQHTVKAVGSGFEGKEIEPLLLSDELPSRSSAVLTSRELGISSRKIFGSPASPVMVSR